MLWKLRKLRASINRIKAELSIPLFRLESLFNVWIPPRNLQSFAHEMPKASMSKKKKKKWERKLFFLQMPFLAKIPLTKVIVADKNNGKTSSISSPTTHAKCQTSCCQRERELHRCDRDGEAVLAKSATTLNGISLELNSYPTIRS